ncbi:hypothetical protein ACNVED_16610 (plasmid) [Legionella sp. D16C41]|uniref:hypothetical protein n=1 Tax=Legionella sp. D16C41 TaxID=3402688 RepID=UPI003AF70D77
MSEHKPLFEDGLVSTSGGEKELAAMVVKILDKNAVVLKDHQIDLSNKFISESNLLILPNKKPNVTSGWVDIENIGTQKFTVKGINTKPYFCPNDLNTLKFEFWLAGRKKLTIQPTEESCGEDFFSIRNVYRTKKALWFIYSKHLKMMAIDTY